MRTFDGVWKVSSHKRHKLHEISIHAESDDLVNLIVRQERIVFGADDIGT